MKGWLLYGRETLEVFLDRRKLVDRILGDKPGLKPTDRLSISEFVEGTRDELVFSAPIPHDNAYGSVLVVYHARPLEVIA